MPSPPYESHAAVIPAGVPDEIARRLSQASLASIADYKRRVSTQGTSGMSNVPKIFSLIDAQGRGLIDLEDWKGAFERIQSEGTREHRTGGSAELITRADWAKLSQGKEMHIYDYIFNLRNDRGSPIQKGISKSDWIQAFQALKRPKGGDPSAFFLNDWESIDAPKLWTTVHTRKVMGADASTLQEDPLPFGLARIEDVDEHRERIRQLKDVALSRVPRRDGDGGGYRQSIIDQKKTQDARLRNTEVDWRRRSVDGTPPPVTGWDGSAEASADIRSLFARFDADQDGTISKDEWLKVFTALAGDNRVVSRKRWTLVGGSNKVFDAMTGGKQTGAGKKQMGVVMSKRDWLDCFDRLANLSQDSWHIVGVDSDHDGVYEPYKGHRFVFRRQTAPSKEGVAAADRQTAPHKEGVAVADKFLYRVAADDTYKWWIGPNHEKLEGDELGHVWGQGEKLDAIGAWHRWEETGSYRQDARIRINQEGNGKIDIDEWLEGLDERGESPRSPRPPGSPRPHRRRSA